MFQRLIIALVLAAFVAIGIEGKTLTQAKERPKDPPSNSACANRVVSSTQQTTVEDRNAFLVEAMEQFKAQQAAQGTVATPEEEAAFIEEVKRNAPAEIVVTTVMTDDPNLIPPAAPDPNDKDDQGRPKLKRFKKDGSFEKFRDRVQARGCRPQRSSNQQMSAMSVAATASWSPTWYYCTAEAYAKNITGQKIIRLVQRQDWLVSIYGTVQDWDPVDVETYAYLQWKTSGSTAITGPKWITSPWQIRATAKQKYILDVKVYTIQTRYLSTALTVGPANQCIASPGWGPGMPGR